jgi:hypothetical protein
MSSTQDAQTTDGPAANRSTRHQLDEAALSEDYFAGRTNAATPHCRRKHFNNSLLYDRALTLSQGRSGRSYP